MHYCMQYIIVIINPMSIFVHPPKLKMPCLSLIGVVQPVPMPLEATRRPRIGYKVIRPPLPPLTGATRSVSAPTTIATGVGGTHVGSAYAYQSSSQPVPASIGHSAPPVSMGQHYVHRGTAPPPLYYPQHTAFPPSMVSVYLEVMILLLAYNNNIIMPCCVLC